MKVLEMDIAVRPVQESDLNSLRDTINSICAEKWYVASVEGFTIDQSRTFLKRILDNSLPQVVAVDRDRVVGWCDILPSTSIGFTHVGHLGMGVHQDYRGHGIGRRLLGECLSLAKDYGLEKVELEVFSDNRTAISLYESHGFEPEGQKLNARKIEGKYQHITLMGLPLRQGTI